MELQRGVCVLCSDTVKTLKPLDAQKFIQLIPCLLDEQHLKHAEFEKVQTGFKICVTCCHKLVIVEAHHKQVGKYNAGDGLEGCCRLCAEDVDLVNVDTQLKYFAEVCEDWERLRTSRFEKICTACLFYLDIVFHFKKKLFAKFPQTQVARSPRTPQQKNSPTTAAEKQRNRKVASASPPGKQQANSARRKSWPPKRQTADELFRRLVPLKRNKAKYTIAKQVRNDAKMFRQVAYVNLSKSTISPTTKARLDRPKIKIRLKPKSHRNKVTFIRDEEDDDVSQEDVLPEIEPGLPSKQQGTPEEENESPEIEPGLPSNHEGTPEEENESEGKRRSSGGRRVTFAEEVVDIEAERRRNNVGEAVDYDSNSDSGDSEKDGADGEEGKKEGKKEDEREDEKEDEKDEEQQKNDSPTQDVKTISDSEAIEAPATKVDPEKQDDASKMEQESEETPKVAEKKSKRARKAKRIEEENDGDDNESDVTPPAKRSKRDRKKVADEEDQEAVIKMNGAGSQDEQEEDKPSETKKDDVTDKIKKYGIRNLVVKVVRSKCPSEEPSSKATKAEEAKKQRRNSSYEPDREVASKSPEDITETPKSVFKSPKRRSSLFSDSSEQESGDTADDTEADAKDTSTADEKEADTKDSSKTDNSADDAEKENDIDSIVSKYVDEEDKSNEEDSVQEPAAKEDDAVDNEGDVPNPEPTQLDTETAPLGTIENGGESPPHTPSPPAEDKSGDPEDKSGDAEEKSGDEEDKSGDVEDKSGDVEDKSGDAEDKSGDAEDKSGDVEEELEDVAGSPSAAVTLAVSVDNQDIDNVDAQTSDNDDPTEDFASHFIAPKTLESSLKFAADLDSTENGCDPVADDGDDDPKEEKDDTDSAKELKRKREDSPDEFETKRVCLANNEDEAD